MAIPENIEQLANDVRTKVYGREVREALASGIEAAGETAEDARIKSEDTEIRQTVLEKQFDDEIANMTLADPSSAEIVAARTNANTGESYDTIGRRLDAEHANVTTQLAEIAKKEVINVMFPFAPGLEGAKADGTDDRPRIQAIIDYFTEKQIPIFLYLPRGYTFTLNSFTDPDLKVLINLSKYISFDGYGELKIADNFGDYYSLTMYTDPIEDVTIKNITINENSTGNPPLHDLSIEPNRHRHHFKGQPINGRVVVDNVKFIDVNPVTCIMFTMCDYEDITNCYIEYSKTVSPSVKYDNSAIWHYAKKGRCENNTIIGNGGAVSAIEVHGADTITTGNIIDGFDQGILLASNYHQTMYQKNLVYYNHIKNVKRGIVLWTDEKYGCSNFDVWRNYIYVHPFKGEDKPNLTVVNERCYGIGTRDTADSPKAFENWHIEDNEVEFYENGYSNTVAMAGIDINLLNVPETADISKILIKGLNIKGNKINKSYGPGISVYLNEKIVSPDDSLSDFLIKNNEITNPFWNYRKNDPREVIVGQQQNPAIVIWTKANIKNLLIGDNDLIVECDDNLVGSRCTIYVDIRSVGTETDVRNEIKVIDNKHNINSPLLFTTLYSRYPILFKGELVEKDLMANTNIYSYMTNGSEFITKRGSHFKLTSLLEINELSARNALRIEYGTTNIINSLKGMWYRGNRIINSTIESVDLIRGWVCTTAGVVPDTQWAANTYLEPGTIFTNSNYPNELYLVLMGGTTGTSMPIASETDPTLDGTVVFKKITYQSMPVFTQFKG